MPRLILIDVMPLLYRGHFGMLSRPRITSSGFNVSALFVFCNVVRDLVTNHGATHVALVADSSPTFRHQRYPAYKAQRDKLPEDIAASLAPAEAFARAVRVPFLRLDGFEADDLMGTLSARAEAEGLETWIVTPDKDLAQLVTDKTLLCRHGKGAGTDLALLGVNDVCAEWDLESPDKMVDFLGMAGDSSDNIPGLPGVGPKTASKLLRQFGSLEGVLAATSHPDFPKSLAKKIAENPDYAEQARLSRWLAEIRRDAPIELTLPDLRVREADIPAVEAFCRQYELFQLLRAYVPGATRNEEPSDLFSLAQPAAKPAGTGAGATGTAPAADGSEDAATATPAVPLATAASTPHSYHLVATRDDLVQLAARLSVAKAFAFDTETTGINPRHDRIVGASFAIEPHEAWYVSVLPFQPANAVPAAAPAEPAAPLDLFAAFGVNLDAPAADAAATAANGAAPVGVSVEEFREVLGPVFANETSLKIGHNLKFDLHVLREIGIEVEGPLSDTMLAHYVVNASARHGMDALSRELLHYDPIPIESLIGPRGKGQKTMDQVSVEKVAEYAAEDADVTLQLHGVLRPMAHEAGADHLLDDAENPLVRVLLDIEDAGVRIDTAALAEYSEKLGDELVQLSTRIFALAGETFTIESSQQLSRILFEKLGLPHGAKTSLGHYSTAEDVLQGLVSQHEIIPLLLDYRACAKLRSTYVQKLPDCIDPRDGRIHTTFNQALTETGRLSSDNPNLQNIPIRTPRGKPIRAAFVAGDENHVLVSADYSQIELRLAAALSGDEEMIAAFRSGADIHRETAARVFGIDPEEVTDAQRASCKQVNFGILYGISAFGLAQRLDCSRTHAEGLIKTYFARFPQIQKWIDKTIEETRARGYAVTQLGRRRPLRDITSRNGTLRAAAERNAVNTPVQGLAADLMKLAMVRVAKALKDKGLSARIVLQIHDELVIDTPMDEVPTVSRVVKDAMEKAMDLPVPLLVEVGFGPNWLAAH